MALKFLKTVKRAVKNWYLPLLAGIVLIAVGIWTFMNPEDSYVGLAFLFSLSFLIMGLFESIFSITNRDIIDNWGWHLVLGIITLAVGILMLINPEISMITLPFYIGFVILFRSIWAIGLALDLRSYGVHSWGNLMALGILGSLLGFMLIWNPIFGGLTAVVLTGLAFILGGILSILISLRLKKLHDFPGKISKELINRYHEIKDEVIKAVEEVPKRHNSSD